MKKLFTEPLFHFLVIGAALFLAFEVLQKPNEGSDNLIVITENDLETIQATFTKTWQRPPTQDELDNLVEEKIRDEIAYAEALAMGLDRDDPYIRRRLRMKMELVLEDIGDIMAPTDKELTNFMSKHKDKFSIEPQFSFSHVFLDKEKRGDTLENDAQQLLQQLHQARTGLDLGQYGDTILLASTYQLSPGSVIDRQFGSRFSANLADLDVGTWQGPIPSSYGFHLVMIHRYKPGREPELSEVRTQVEREFTAERRKEIKDRTYVKLRERYRIVKEYEAKGQS